MNIILFNTKTSKQEKLVTLKKDTVGMYVCGPTVYRMPHCGNLRSMIVFDTLYRLLQQYYPNVVYVRNITDIDDKIIAESKRLQIPHHILTKNIYTDLTYQLQKLNILPPTHEPFATAYIPDIIKDIKQLISLGHAYVDKGNVFFNTDQSFYKQLCPIQCSSHARVAHHPGKQGLYDFALWKQSNEEPFFDSPWGSGRPGWHIECTSMSRSLLGDVFDIHGGGQDLRFPHHVNEQAQGIGLHGSCCANYWIHNHFVQLDKVRKISKSIDGHEYAIDKITQVHDPMVLRLAMLLTHYRHPIFYNEDLLAMANAIFTKLHKKLCNVQGNGQVYPDVLAALSEDMNTPNALTLAYQYLKDPTSYPGLVSTYEILFGLKFYSSSDARINDLVNKRNHARMICDYETADHIRNQLKTLGIWVEDHGSYSTWGKNKFASCKT